MKKRLTKRAPDPSTSSGQAVWESARFRSIFLASGFSCSQTLSTPAHTQVTQTVRRLRPFNNHEHFGKIVYTAQQFPAPFDHSAGWEIAKYLKEIVLQRNEVECTLKAWSILANPSFIILDKPIMCHPNCPTCLMNGLNKK